jgi:hypothetical protein
MYPRRHDIIFETSESLTTFWNPLTDLVTAYVFGEGTNACNTTREVSGTIVYGLGRRYGSVDLAWDEPATFNGIRKLLADGPGEKLSNLV